jgi:hypothetical protein
MKLQTTQPELDKASGNGTELCRQKPARLIRAIAGDERHAVVGVQQRDSGCNGRSCTAHPVSNHVKIKREGGRMSKRIGLWLHWNCTCAQDHQPRPSFPLSRWFEPKFEFALLFFSSQRNTALRLVF